MKINIRNANGVGHWRVAALMPILILTTAMIFRAGAAVSVSQGTCDFGDRQLASYTMENEFAAFTIVPARGGRIVEWIDKRQGGANVVDLPRDADRPDYGGLLDDHGWVSMVVERSHFWNDPFVCEVVTQTPDEAVLEIRSEEYGHYLRRLTLRAGSPLLQIEYRFDNNSQEDSGNSLIRNVVWPSGGPDTDDHLYSTPLTKGVRFDLKPVNTARASRDKIAANWRAVGSIAQRRLVGFVFDDDLYQGAYDWQGSVTRPSLEWYYRPIAAGNSAWTKMYALIAHGFSKAVHVSETLVADLDIERSEEGVEIAWALSALDSKLTEATLKTWVADTTGETIDELPDIRLTNLVVDKRREGKLLWKSTAERPVVILQSVIGNGTELARYEQPFELGTTSYERQMVKVKPAEITAIDGWKRIPPLEVKPSKADLQRGFAVYSGEGERRGESVDKIKIDLGSGGEYESIELRVKALADIGTNMTLTVERPGGVPMRSLTVTGAERRFVANIWAKDHYGWRLSGDGEVRIDRQEDARFWLIANSTDLEPGSYSLEIVLAPEKGAAARLPVILEVSDVRIPEDLHYFLEANTSFNQLGQRPKIGPNTKNWSWNITNNAVYADDFQSHGGRVLTAYGHGTAVGYNYPSIRLRDGRGLVETLVEDSSWLNDAEPLPDLDLSFWDPWLQIWLERGFTRFTTRMGAISSYWDRHGLFAKRYNGDPQRIRRWLMSETARYLKEKGFRYLYVTLGDEIAPDVFPSWMKAAADVKECGWSPGVTISSKFFRDPEVYLKAGPMMEYFVISSPDGELVAKARADGIIAPGNAVVSYTGSGGRYREYADMRSQMWYRTMAGMDTFWIQCYIRKPGESVVFNEDNHPYSSAAWEGLRDGCEDGNYIKGALGMIGILEKTQPQAAADFNDKLARLVASLDKEDAATIRTAKLGLMELLREMRRELPPCKPSLLWEELPIVEEGRPLFALAASPEGNAAAKKLAELIKRKTDVALGVSDAGKLDTIKTNTILIGHPDDTEILRRMNAEKRGLGVTATYPAADSYMVLEREIDGRRTILIIGKGEGLLRGVDNFGRFLKLNPDYPSQYFIK